MSTQLLEKTIKDDEGNDHLYELRQHPAEEGFALLPDIIEIVGNSLKGYNQGTINITDEDVLSKIDIGSLGEIAASVAMNIKAHGGVKLVKSLLKYCMRDGDKFSDKTLTADGQWSFNEAYQGNYGELVGAIIFCLEANFSSFFRGMLRDQ